MTRLCRRAAIRVFVPVLVLVPLWISGCRMRGSASVAQANVPASASAPDACALALVPHAGSDPIDTNIARLQKEVVQPRRAVSTFIELGQQFIAKARTTRDHGFYVRADECARCVEKMEPGNAQALLLRGHVLHQAHRFKEAEPLARQLVARRGLFLDYGLLGDVLMEQGKVDEAGEAYQRMMDLKPFYHSYTRAAHLRWLKGDLPGALQLIRLAVKAASPRDREAVAWAYARLALYELQSGRPAAARDACDAALTWQADYPAARLVRGRAWLAEGKPDEAARDLRIAATNDPVPEHQWALAEALAAAGRTDEAHAIHASLQQTGALADPRTFALYLATRGERVDVALALARRELEARADVFTLDALAWSLAAAGQAREADEAMTKALQQGTADARLFYHAGAIAASLEDRPRARRYLRKALALQQMLLPSEQSHVVRMLARGKVS